MAAVTPEREHLERRTDTLLEWPVLLRRLADCAITPMAKESCLALCGAGDAASAAEAYDGVREWMLLRERGKDFPLSAESDVRPALRAAIPGGLLDAEHCREIAVVLDQAHDVRRTVADCPDLRRLTARVAPLDELPVVRRALAEAIDPLGRLRESATPDLLRLRREVDRQRQIIIDRVGELVREPQYEPWLQDTFVTQREERYVLPVKVEHRGKVAGIVHDLSASGVTVFIEPEELVAANNDLKWAEMAVAQEIERIFRHLTDLVVAHRATIAANLDILTALDVIQAKGRLGVAYRGSIPAVSRTGAVAWRGLRHPLLALRGAAVVENDVTLDPAVRALVISGPNTGGKTVLLKAMGLAALMTRTGIPLPCDPESVSPVFPAVLMDAGDDQDLERDLSTFAAHIRVVSTLLAAAPEGSLILLDELATATDPEEGAALAQALVEALSARRMVTVVTTHYTALKTWAADPSGVGTRISAGMGYDVEQMTPTYRLSLGRPGASLGLDVAARLGLPASILDRAKSLVAPQAAALAGAIAALDRERQAVADSKVRLSAIEASARDAALRQDAAAAALERARDEFVQTKRTRLSAEIRRAKTDLDGILDAARKESEPRTIRALRPRIDAVAESSAPPSDEVSRGSQRDYDAGARVRVASLAADGVLLDATHGRKRVRVRVGDREVSVAASQLRPGADEATTAQTRPGPAPRPATGDPGPDTIDVIGARVEEALDRIDRALDRAAAAGVLHLRLLHGHGTGRLKTAIRAHLAASPYVASHRRGDEPEGGDAVTIVTLTTGP